MYKNYRCPKEIQNSANRESCAAAMVFFNLYLSEIGFTQSVIGTVLSARSFGSVLMTIPAALI